MGIADFEHWNVHRHTSTFGKCTNLDGKITEIVECSYLLDGICTLAESVTENSFVLRTDFISGFVEKLVIEIVNEIFLDECLQSEEYEVVVVNTRHTRGHIGDELCYIGRKLIHMICFIVVAA